jgi:DNA polymerase-3 subunit gamma/tau
VEIADGAGWAECLRSLSLKGAARELASNCAWTGMQGDQVSLMLPPSHEQLRSAKSVERLREALSGYLGREVRVTVTVGAPSEETPAQARARRAAERQTQAEAAIANDRVAKGLIEQFGAELIPGSVKPAEKTNH